jgi:hypothetical protein
VIPTSAALDAHIEMMATYYDMRPVSAATMRHDLAVLRRLQHEASTAKPVKVWDLERERRLRDEGMSCWHPTDPEAA